MIASILALASAASWGVSDFAGGFSSKVRSPWAVVLWSNAFALPILALGFMVVDAAAPSTRDLGVGALAGLAGIFGLGFLYRGLATGVMSVVAPTTGAGAVLAGVVFGAVRGDRLASLEWFGIAVAVTAIILVAADPGGGVGDARAVRYALFAGISFALFFYLISFASADAGLWPLVPARLVGLVVAGVLAGQDRWPPVRERFGWTATAGAGDILGNIFSLLAIQQGVLTLMVALSSLYPVVTILIAIVYLRERPRPVQVLGMVAGLAAIGLLA